MKRVGTNRQHEYFYEEDDGSKLAPLNEKMVEECMDAVLQGWMRVNPNTPISKPALFSIVSWLWEKGLLKEVK